MFVFRLSWIECLDFEQLIIQQSLKGINEIWRFSAGTIVAMAPKNIQPHIAATVCTCSPCPPPVHIPAGQPWWPERSFLLIFFKGSRKSLLLLQPEQFRLSYRLLSSVPQEERSELTESCQHTNCRGEQNSTVKSRVLIMLVKEPIRLVRRCRLLNNKYTSRNMPTLQSLVISTIYLAGILSTTSS